MSLQAFFAPLHFAQTLLLALSTFNLVTFLWLALTVWLNGDKRAWITRLGVVGLSFSALFFFIHALLISSPPSGPHGIVSPDFLWHLIWLPAISVPYIWFAIGLYYAALINKSWSRRRPLLLVSSGILGLSILLLLILYRSTFTFVGTLRLLAYGDLFEDRPPDLFSVSVLVPILFLCYVTFCAIGPWFTLGRVSRIVRACWRGAFDRRVAAPVSTLRQELANAFWNDPADPELQEEPILSWHLARPGLFFAAIWMVGLTTTLGILGIGSIVDAIGVRQQGAAQAAQAGQPVMLSIPLDLLLLDALATGAVAVIILLVGYSIVRHGILIERPLARRGFFEQWRGIVIVATTVALFIVLLVSFTHSGLGGLLLITALATAVYALFTWSSYTAHDRYIALLGPFMRSTNLRHWLNTDPAKTEQGLHALFFHLCHDVLAVQWARLSVVAGPIRRSFNYRWPLDVREEDLYVASHRPSRNGLPESARTGGGAPVRARLYVNGQPIICWMLPIYDELGLVAMLYLGPRQDGAPFTDEDMDLAHACGQRILDTLGDHEAMQAVAGLLRRRIVDVKLLGAQHRRIIHDDILPQMHLALLRLETLRGLGGLDVAGGTPARVRGNDHTALQEVLREAVDLISDAHRRLAAMMRATAPSAPHRLERDGLMPAIHTMLEQDFQHAFDEVEWHVDEETACCIDEVAPPAIAELIFAAVQESLRNAARHARGTDVHRRLRLTLSAACSRAEPYLDVVVADDGVGIISASTSTSGTGGGLLTHGALLAIAGGSLNVKSAPGEGVSVRILLPPEALR